MERNSSRAAGHHRHSRLRQQGHRAKFRSEGAPSRGRDAKW